jgi:hypothetical protein
VRRIVKIKVPMFVCGLAHNKIGVPSSSSVLGAESKNFHNPGEFSFPVSQQPGSLANPRILWLCRFIFRVECCFIVLRPHV